MLFDYRLYLSIVFIKCMHFNSYLFIISLYYHYYKCNHVNLKQYLNFTLCGCLYSRHVQISTRLNLKIISRLIGIAVNFNRQMSAQQLYILNLIELKLLKKNTAIFFKFLILNLA